RGGFGGLLAIARGAVARGQVALEPVGGGLAFGERRVAPRQRLLERGGSLSILAGLLLGRDENLVGVFLGFEERLFFARLGVALGVLDDAQRRLFGAADGFGGDALSVRHPHREHGAGRDGGADDRREQI